jgi:hypothetical protein
MSSLLEGIFVQFEILIFGTQMNGSSKIFQRILFIGFLKNTQKIEFESKKLWSQAIVQKGLKIYICFKNAYVFPPFRRIPIIENVLERIVNI